MIEIDRLIGREAKEPFCYENNPTLARRETSWIAKGWHFGNGAGCRKACTSCLTMLGERLGLVPITSRDGATTSPPADARPIFGLTRRLCTGRLSKVIVVISALLPGSPRIGAP